MHNASGLPVKQIRTAFPAGKSGFLIHRSVVQSEKHGGLQNLRFRFESERTCLWLFSVIGNTSGSELEAPGSNPARAAHGLLV